MGVAEHLVIGPPDYALGVESLLLLGSDGPGLLGATAEREGEYQQQRSHRSSIRSS